MLSVNRPVESAADIYRILKKLLLPAETCLLYTSIYDEQLYRLIGRSTGTVYALGQRVTVKVTAVDLAMRRVEFALEEAETVAGTKLHKQAHRTRNQKKAQGKRRRGRQKRRRR